MTIRIKNINQNVALLLVEAMKLVDISDRAIDDWWKTFTTMWNTYDTKISAKPTLACTDWENLLKELGEIKTQIGLVSSIAYFSASR